MQSPVTKDLLDSLVAIAWDAGTAILEIYDRADVGEQTKADGSPLTAADGAAEAVIVPRLEALAIAPVISEENADSHGLSADGGGPDRFWLVDPLDGTKEFLKRNGEFTVNIALVENGRPIAGVVHAPALGRLTYAGADGVGSFQHAGENWSACKPMTTREPQSSGVTVVESRSHGSASDVDQYLADAGLTVSGRRQIGSSLKLCLVASGEADIYPRFGPTMEWDTAAGDAVLRAAGGTVMDVGGTDLLYGKASLRNPYFVARGWSA